MKGEMGVLTMIFTIFIVMIMLYFAIDILADSGLINRCAQIPQQAMEDAINDCSERGLVLAGFENQGGACIWLCR